ncbi:MAG: N-formylglutamate amidohydrolase [Kordiimonadaceae bacterium]|nr:N-formylglutamate amidohydrolase [Kordiimonadaceae bacterium]
MHPEVLNPDEIAGLIILCEHASNHIPKDYQQLGLEDEELERHIAWDIGAAEVARHMAEMMGAPAVLGTVSRLLIDPNRAPDQPGLVPTSSDGVFIPANQDLSAAALAVRKAAVYDPFHEAAGRLVQRHLDAGIVPLVVGMHSFTPDMGDEERPWQIGFLWNNDPRLAQAMIGLLERETELLIGDNEPYSGKDLYYTMERHGAAHGLPQTTIEIRQDLLSKPEMTLEWAGLLADLLDECMNRDDLTQIRHF